MKILICEDNERKYNDIREAIRIVMPEAKITWCKYAKTGVQELRNNEYDFLIQDMQLPLHSDEKIMIKGGWTDIDVIITMPSIMGKIGALGRVLGPRGLMPNPKSGTVTMDVAKAVKEVKQGKIDFKVDKSGIVHTSIGKVSFTADQIRDNAKEFIATIIKLKPSSAKGTYIKSIYLSSTMSKGIKIDPKTVEEN
jgi:ribosomal protein L1